MIYVRRSIDRYAVAGSNLQQREVTAKCVNTSERPVKLLAVYLPPMQPLVDAGLSECIRRGKPVLLVAHLDAKHKHLKFDTQFCKRSPLERVCVREFLHRPWTRYPKPQFHFAHDFHVGSWEEQAYGTVADWQGPRYQRWIGTELKEWSNTQWADKLEFLN